MKRVLLAGAALLISCADPTIKDGAIESIFTKEREVEHTAEVAIAEPLCNNQLVGIVGKNAILQMYGPTANYNFYIVDVETGEVKNKIVGVGRGRNEMIYPEYIGISDGRICLLDQINEFILTLPIDDLLKKNVNIEFEKIKVLDRSKEFFIHKYLAVANRFIAYKCVRSENDPYLMTTTIEDGQLQEGERFFHFGEGEDDEHKIFTYYGCFSVSPQGDAMMYCTGRGVYLRFYECGDDTCPPQLVKEYNLQVPEYKVEESGSGQRISMSVKPSDDTIVGFAACFTDEDSFYMPFQNITFRERVAMTQEGNEEVKSSDILVFDKKGKPREKLIIKEGVNSQIQYCAYNDSFYAMGFNDDGEDCLMQYKF